MPSKKLSPLENDFLTTVELSRLSRLQTQTLRAWRSKKPTPIPFIRVSKNKVVYRRADVEAFLASREVR